MNEGYLHRRDFGFKRFNLA